MNLKFKYIVIISRNIENHSIKDKNIKDKKHKKRPKQLDFSLASVY